MFLKAIFWGIKKKDKSAEKKTKIVRENFY